MWQIVVPVLVGAAVALVAVAYWDRIKEWLNTIVADKIEKVFGYGARKRVHHAVTIVDKYMGRIRERAFVYVKKMNAAGYDKYAEKQYKIIEGSDTEIVKEIESKDAVIQEFTYTE